MLELNSGVATVAAPVAAGELDEVDDAIRVLHVVVPISGGDADAVNALLIRLPRLRVRLVPRGDERLVDLSALESLPAVRHLLVDFGALYSDVGDALRLEGIQHAPALERLQIHLDKPVSLAPLTGHPGLRGLLVAGPHRGFEVLAELPRLEDLILDTMKGIEDFSPLAGAPALTALAMYAMPQVRPDDVAPLREHPTLEVARIGTGSSRRNAEIETLLGLPDTWKDPGYIRRWAA